MTIETTTMERTKEDFIKLMRSKSADFSDSQPGISAITIKVERS